MLQPDGVMVRQRTAKIDEALLDGALHHIVLFERTRLIGWTEGKRET